MSITLLELSHAIGIGLGASRSESGRWHFDLRHKPPRGRLPMAFFVKAVAAPAALCRPNPLNPVPLDEVEAPQLADYEYSSLARPMLVFAERTARPLLPHEFEHGTTSEGQQLYWRLVSTDSCEATHCGALLTMRALALERGVELIDEDSGETIVHFGMINARRIAPFERAVLVYRDGVRVQEEARGGLPGTSTRKPPRLTFDAESLPRRPTQGGALHQLIYMQTASGRELLMDFTGPQYGVEPTLPATGTPCWRCVLGSEASWGYQACGGVAAFSEPAQVHPAILKNQMHALVASWVRDSALGVLDHRDANGLPLVTTIDVAEHNQYKYDHEYVVDHFM